MIDEHLDARFTFRLTYAQLKKLKSIAGMYSNDNMGAYIRGCIDKHPAQIVKKKKRANRRDLKKEAS